MMVHHLTILSVIHRLQPRYRIVVLAFGNGNTRHYFARFSTVPMLHSQRNPDDVIRLLRLCGMPPFLNEAMSLYHAKGLNQMMDPALFQK